MNIRTPSVALIGGILAWVAVSGDPRLPLCLEAEVELPPGAWLDWGGQFENLVEAKRRLSVVVPICFVVIFALLLSTLRSARYAAMVFTGVRLALSGGILALWLRDMPFSISAAIGFIALSGVAVLNGLVLLSFIEELRRAGASLDEAIGLAAAVRLRPILMTALVAFVYLDNNNPVVQLQAIKIKRHLELFLPKVRNNFY